MSSHWIAQPARWCATALASTWRMDIVGEQHVAALREAGEPFVFTLWHDSLFAPLWHRRGQGISLLVSRSRDATTLASAARRWGYGVVEGSSTNGAVPGLRGLVRVLRSAGIGAVTPDGPRGPARLAKPGVLRAARLAGAALVPVGMAASREWRVASWDRFRIPQPFARVRIAYGEPRRLSTDDVRQLAGLIDRAEGVARCRS